MASNTDVEPSTPNSETESTDVLPSIIDLYKSKQWLQGQVNQLSAALIEGEANKEETTDAEILEERIRKYGKELNKETCDNLIRQQLLERLQYTDTLIKILFPASEPTGAEAEKTYTHVKKEIELQNEVSSLVMKLQEESRELRKQFNNLRKERIQVMTRNRELMARLKQTEEEPEASCQQHADDAQVERARATTEEETNKAKLLTGIFQGCIVGSGVDWAADDTLRELVMELGQPLHQVLRN